MPACYLDNSLDCSPSMFRVLNLCLVHTPNQDPQQAAIAS